MRLIDILHTASGNMFRSKLRTTLTIVAIFIGSFTLTLTNGLGSGISAYIDKELGNLGAKDVIMVIPTASQGGGPSSDGPKAYDSSKKTAATAFGTTTTVLTQDDIDKIKKVDGIKSVTPNLVVSPDYIVGANGQQFQVSANPFISGSNIDLSAGTEVSNDATERQVMLPVEYVSSLGYASDKAAVGQTVTIGITDSTGKSHAVTATVTGIQQKSLINSGGMSTNDALTKGLYADQTIGLPAALTASYQSVYAKFDSSYSDAQITNLKDRLKTAGYAAQTLQDAIGTFKQVVNGIIIVLDVFAIIALLAASFGIINTLLMSVQERTKEIGLMKAMGMSAGRIFLLFSTEAVMLGFWGSLIGVVIAEIIGHVADHIVSTGFLKDLTGLQLLAFPIQSVATIVGIVMVIAFLAGTLPAFRAARQSPIDSLRYE